MYPGFMDCTQAIENQVAKNMPHEMEGGVVVSCRVES